MKCTPRPNQKAGDAMKGMVRFKQFYRLVHAVSYTHLTLPTNREV